MAALRRLPPRPPPMGRLLPSMWLVRTVCRAAAVPRRLCRPMATASANSLPAVEESCPAEGHGCNCSFDMELIRSGRPFPSWLQGEMRSNHAGETGAVEIYNGALWALRVRRRMANLIGSNAPPEADGDGSCDDQLRNFAAEHRASEQHHLDLLEEILEPGECSRLLPGWRLAGRGLGIISTLWCSRGMYLTTAAVEEFVESHYQHQITRLRDDPAHANHAPLVELRRMLQHCCEDEVHHKEEAAARAAEGPLPWFAAVDSGWQWLVGTGSAIAARAAKAV